MSKDEKKALEAFRQLSASGRVDVMSHINTVLKAENGVKKAYGLDKKKPTAKRKKKSA